MSFFFCFCEGITSVLQGGKFGHGFASGGIGAYTGSAKWLQGAGRSALRIGVSAIVGGTVSDATGGKFKNGAVTAAFSAAVSAGVGALGDNENSEPEHITGRVQKRFGKKNVSVVSTDQETNIKIKLKVERDLSLSQAEFDASIKDINREWNTSRVVDGHTYKVTTELIVVDTISNPLARADLVFRDWSSVPAEFRSNAGLNSGRNIWVNRDVNMRNGVPAIAARPTTAAHEFGHALGLGHQASSTNSIT